MKYQHWQKLEKIAFRRCLESFDFKIKLWSNIKIKDKIQRATTTIHPKLLELSIWKKLLLENCMFYNLFLNNPIEVFILKNLFIYFRVSAKTFL